MLAANVVAAPTPASAPKPSAAPSPTSVRAGIKTYLQKKAGVTLSVPFTNEPIQWWEKSRTDVGDEAAAQWKLLGQTLLLSQSLLESQDQSRRKTGLLLAGVSANFLGAVLPDEKWLMARVYQGFILPNVSLASVEVARYPSRQRLLEEAVGAFGSAGESAHQQRTLEWLLQIGDKKGSSLQVDDNTLDWARGTLASLLIGAPNAPRADLKRALELLHRIRSKDMTGFAHIQAQLEDRLKHQPSTSTAPTTNPTP